MDTDSIDEMNAAWRTARPDLDPTALGLVGRVLVLARHLEASVEKALAPLKLSLGQFDILATLRRAGPDAKVTPTHLMKSVMLSSGGMTNRLDRLEQAELVRREADPDDRRGSVISLTPKGRRLIDEAIGVRFREATSSAPELGAKDRAELERLLRAWLAAVETS